MPGIFIAVWVKRLWEGEPQSEPVFAIGSDEESPFQNHATQF
jgi:hypothetical protein